MVRIGPSGQRVKPPAESLVAMIAAPWRPRTGPNFCRPATAIVLFVHCQPLPNSLKEGIASASQLQPVSTFNDAGTVQHSGADATIAP